MTYLQGHYDPLDDTVHILESYCINAQITDCSCIAQPNRKSCDKDLRVFSTSYIKRLKICSTIQYKIQSPSIQWSRFLNIKETLILEHRIEFD